MSRGDKLCGKKLTEDQIRDLCRFEQEDACPFVVFNKMSKNIECMFGTGRYIEDLGVQKQILDGKIDIALVRCGYLGIFHGGKLVAPSASPANRIIIKSS